MALHHAAANGKIAVLKILLSEDSRICTKNGAVCLKDARKLGLDSNCRCVNSGISKILDVLPSFCAMHTSCLGCASAF
jgi:hypothetical protein